MRRPPKDVLIHERRNGQFLLEVTGHPKWGLPFGQDNVVEQDHRTVKKRVWLAKGYGSFATAWRTLQGIEAVNMIRKGRARWVAKGDTIAQADFISALFGIAA